MRRLFWLTLGAALGAWGVLRAQRLARRFGPRGAAQRAVTLGTAMRAFAADVRSEMHRREAELRQTFDGTPSIGPPRALAARDNHNRDKDGH
jgi:hypothetical protein